MGQLAVLYEKNIKIIREIPKEELIVLQEHIDTLNLLSKDFNRLSMVKNSLNEYENCINKYINKKTSNSDFLDNIIELIFKYVASFRAFLDQWETYIKRKYGKKSNEVNKFKKATGIEYDKFFSYRFIYELRNYTLHCDIPVSRVSAKLDECGKYSVDVIVDRDKLLQTYEWPSKVRLEEMPAEFEIYQHLKQSLACLTRIHQVALNLGDTRRIYESALAILKIKVDNKDESGSFAIINFSSSSDMAQSLMNTYPIPVEFARELIKMLVENNS